MEPRTVPQEPHQMFPSKHIKIHISKALFGTQKVPRKGKKILRKMIFSCLVPC